MQPDEAQYHLTTVYPALHSLLSAVAQTFPASEACIVSPRGAAESVTMASSRQAQLGPSSPFEDADTDVSVDVSFEGDVIGRLVLVSPSGPVDPSRLAPFAITAGHILGQSESMRQAAVAREESRVLRDLSLQLGERNELIGHLKSVVAGVRQLLRADYACVALATADGSTRWVAVDGSQTDALLGMDLPPGTGMAGRVVEAGTTLVFEATGPGSTLSAEEFPAHAAEGGVSGVGAPMMRGGQILGVLMAGSRRPRTWTAAEQELMSVLANTAAVVSAQASDSRDERMQRDFLEKIIENFPGVLVVMESPPSWRIRALNTRMASVLPEQFHNVQDAIGRTAQELSPNQEDRASQQSLDILMDVFETGVTRSFEQHESTGPGGETTYWNWSVLRIGDDHDDERFVMLMAHDITEAVRARKQAQESGDAARARADELESVINQMIDGVAIIDRTGTPIKMNPAGERILGRGALRPGEIAPDQLSNFYSVHYPNGALYESAQLPASRAVLGDTVVGEEVHIRRPNGEEVILSVSAAPLTSPDGSIAGAVAVMRDVTQDKMLERMKDEFLSVVSHELRTPLSAIMGYSDLMLRGVHGGLNDRQARALKAVRANASRLLHLINDLLDASKLESGAMPVTLESHNIGEVVQRTITQTRVLAVEAGLDLVNKVTPERNLRVLADEPKLQQVFENLLANAIKFTPAGGTIDFDADYSELDPGAPELLNANTRAMTAAPGKARSLVVSVSDTGAGIDQEQIERIWDRFYQVDASAKRRSGGAGLGLAIVRGLLSLHGGQVWVESPGANEGSTFRFSLPLAPGVSANEATSKQVSAADSAPSPSNGALLEGNLVLVAEDDADQREIICDMLELEGYNVVLAADGAEAIELADRLQPSAIALDVILPRNDGWEVLNHLKQNPRTMDIPVLIISVVDQQDFGRKLGADAYLLKPIEPMALRETVRRMLQGRNGAESQRTGEA